MKPRLLLPFVLLAVASLTAGPALAQEAPPRLLIRSDDMGFSHGFNVANQQLLESGLAFNISVLFAAPWYKETVDILKRYPDVSVGVHLCANSEWKNYKWGPVAGRTQVPSLVNEDGHFFGSYRELNVEHTPRVEDLETEFRAQIERALASGLAIDYVDNHMGAGMHTPEQRAMVERLAQEYDLAISGYFGDERAGRFSDVPLEEQLARLNALIDSLAPDSLYRLVFHVGTDTPELQAMQDLNEGGAPNMSEQRQLEMEMLLSAEFQAALTRGDVRLVTYRDLIREHGTANHPDE